MHATANTERMPELDRIEKNRISLGKLVHNQTNKCYYCACQMNRRQTSQQRATIEHLVDKWSSLGHVKIESDSNIVAACYQCNNERGVSRNRIARSYYRKQAIAQGMRISVDSISSKDLFLMFGAIPQHLFNEKEIENA